MVSAIENIFSFNNKMLTGIEIMLSAIQTIFSTLLNMLKASKKVVFVTPTSLIVKSCFACRCRLLAAFRDAVGRAGPSVRLPIPS
jgi:hypothetical protein